MIKLKNKHDCCGCAACVQRCPKQCITMSEDEEGFLYPHVNSDNCIDCGLCEKVCPIINQDIPRSPLEILAGKNPDDKIRIQSSSGGIFTILAERIIDEKGVVFGVSFNKHWEAVHSYTETKEGLAAFRMSKYVQSIVGNTFKEAEIFLKQGRKVLYSGTPCQISGLKKYLRKEYENLLTIDFICHGVPSPGVFRWYLGEEIARIAHKNSKNNTFILQPIPLIPKSDILAKEYGFKIKDIRFRDKRHGWKKFCFVLELSKINSVSKKNYVFLSQTLNKNAFLRGFLKDLYLRPSCHYCTSKELKSGSDITIGDFWGIENIKPEIDDNKGISAIVINTNKGKTYMKYNKDSYFKMDFKSLCKYNPALIHSSYIQEKRSLFFTENNKTFFHKINSLCKTSLISRIGYKFLRLYKYILKHKTRNL